jgi:nucleoid DNA-binding protein
MPHVHQKKEKYNIPYCKTPKEVKEYVQAIYNMSEITAMVKRYYDTTYPTGTRLGQARIRAMLMFMFDVIAYIVYNGDNVTIPGFGVFKSHSVKGTHMYNHLRDQMVYRPAFKRVSFQTHKRFASIMNNQSEEGFGDNEQILRDLHDFDNPPPEKVDELEKLKNKLLARLAENIVEEENKPKKTYTKKEPNTTKTNAAKKKPVRRKKSTTATSRKKKTTTSKTRSTQTEKN